MPTGLNRVVEHLHQVLAPPVGDDVADGQLLARFVAARDQVSFEALVRRHGPLVLGVCRRVLHHAQDAEDAFQATFLVLARKAAVVRRDAVVSWLYAVAYRTALEARTVNARRRARERQVGEMPHPEVAATEVLDWRPLLDQELARLHESYRSAVVLCDLEGRSRKEAAQVLGLPEGTISSRLARGRRLLAKRLARHGLAPAGCAMASALSEGASAAVPASLVASTVKAAALVAAGQSAAVAAPAAVLMKGVLQTMFLAKLKLVAGVVTVAIALGATGFAYRAGVGPGSAQAAPPAARSDADLKAELEALRRENDLLRQSLQLALEKVKAQEAEIRTVKEREAHAKQLAADANARAQALQMSSLNRPFTGTTGYSALSFNTSSYGFSSSFGLPQGTQFGSSSFGAPLYNTVFSVPAVPAVPDRVKDVEAAYKKLREAGSDDAKGRAYQELEKAIKALKAKKQ
jgi:RNA polymerase sigma factor (sigma-70 family)